MSSKDIATPSTSIVLERLQIKNISGILVIVHLIPVLIRSSLPLVIEAFY